MMPDFGDQLRPRGEAGGSRLTVILAVVLLVMTGFVARGLIPSGAPAPEPQPSVPAAPPSRSQGLPDAEVKRAIERARADERNDVGYGSPQVPKPVDRQIVSRLEALVADAENLVRRGRSESMRIPEASADAGLRTDAAQTASAAWEDWTRSWSARVDDLGRRLARQGGAITFDQPEYPVYQDLTSLMNDLRIIPISYATTTNIPSLGERESKFSSADWRIAEAKQKLFKLRKALAPATSPRD